MKKMVVLVIMVSFSAMSQTRMGLGDLQFSTKFHPSESHIEFAHKNSRLIPKIKLQRNIKKKKWNLELDQELTKNIAVKIASNGIKNKKANRKFFSGIEFSYKRNF